MKAVFLTETKKLELRDIPIPEYKTDEVLIRIKETGLCGSDLHYYKYGKVGDHIVTEPHILGHESSGIVVETGAAVTNLKKGDRVSIEPGLPCLHCEHCLSGRYNLCESVKFLGVPPFQGTFREFVAHRADFTHKLPDNLDFTMGALVEPLSVGYHTIQRLKPKFGGSLLITGAGPIGISCMIMAGLAGIVDITITDIDDFRLGIAGEMGASTLINVNNHKVSENKFDCAIEASGAQNAFKIVLQGIKKGGHIAFVGMSDSHMSMNLNQMLKKEALITGIYRYVNSYKPVLNILNEHAENLSKMVTHRFKLSELAVAVNTALDLNVNSMKIIIES